MRFLIAPLCGLSLGLMSGAALAEPAGFVSEVKLGVLAHDVPILGRDNREGGVDINGEILFQSVDLLGPDWQLRPHLGLQVNLSGGTSQAYAGLSATRYLSQRIWGTASVGGAIHTGETTDFDEDRKSLGSRALFRLAVELGVDVTQNASVSLYFDHESNASLGTFNPGLDNVGVRAGWRF